MRMLCFLAIVAALACGCSRPADPPRSAKSVPATARPEDVAKEWDALKKEGVSDPPPEPAPPEQQWAIKLKDENPAVRDEAKRRLSDLGEQGYPLLLDGMKGPSPEVRLACVEAIYMVQLVDHKKETLPVMLTLLNDQNADVRSVAARRLGDFGRIAPKSNAPGKAKDPLTATEAQRIIDELRKVASNVKEDHGLREQALKSARTMEWASTGQMKPCEKIRKGQPIEEEKQ